jgi:hypothetical protein
MSNNNQSSVEYLIKEFSEILGPISTNPMQDLLLMDAMKQAKVMHKQEIKISYRCGAAEVGMIEINKPEQYYNETYGE